MIRKKLDISEGFENFVNTKKQKLDLASDENNENQKKIDPSAELYKFGNFAQQGTKDSSIIEQAKQSADDDVKELDGAIETAGEYLPEIASTAGSLFATTNPVGWALLALGVGSGIYRDMTKNDKSFKEAASDNALNAANILKLGKALRVLKLGVPALWKEYRRPARSNKATDVARQYTDNMQPSQYDEKTLNKTIMDMMQRPDKYSKKALGEVEQAAKKAYNRELARITKEGIRLKPDITQHLKETNKENLVSEQDQDRINKIHDYLQNVDPSEQDRVAFHAHKYPENFPKSFYVGAEMQTPLRAAVFAKIFPHLKTPNSQAGANFMYGRRSTEAFRNAQEKPDQSLTDSVISFLKKI